MSKIIEKEKERIIGNYSLGKTIGEGTFGKVKLGLHLPTGEKVAIKILEKDKILEQPDIERVAKEIQILKMLRHQHIIQLYEIIETPKELFLIMEYANGGELFDFIVANTKVKEKLACKFFQTIISGVEYIHKIGVVHRDLKPENLLLDSQQNIKIVDFGLSNTYKGEELLKTACGSPCYAAPEMISGQQYHGLGVDIWSCGVIMFALVCGYLPFEDPNTALLYKKIIAGEYQIPKFISNEAKDLLSCILNTNPTKRYTIQQIRDHQWYKLYQSQNQNDMMGIIVGQDTIKLDEQIVDQLKDIHKVDPIQCRKMVQNNRHNHITTLYYLTQQKNQRQKTQSFYQSQLKNYVKSEQNTKYTNEDSIDVPLQAQQGAQQKQKQIDPIKLEDNLLKIQKARLEVPNSPQLIQTQLESYLERDVMIKGKINFPPMKKLQLQFNPISQAVNNSISSIGTNNTNTPLATTRKVRDDVTLDDKKLRNIPKDLSYLQHPFTDRITVDRQQWNNSYIDGIKYQINEKLKTENSPQQGTIKPLIHNSEYINDLGKRNFQSTKFPQPASEYQSNKPGQTINMSYYVQHKLNDMTDTPSRADSHKHPKLHQIDSFQGRPKVTTSQHAPSYQRYQSSSMKVHKGAFNLQCVSAKQSQQLMNDLVSALQSLTIEFDQKTPFELTCHSKEQTRFEIGIHLLVKCEGVHLIKGKFLQGDRQLFSSLSNTIIQTMNLQMLF